MGSNNSDVPQIRLWHNLALAFRIFGPQGCPSDCRRGGICDGKSVEDVLQVESSRSTTFGLSASGSLLKGINKKMFLFNSSGMTS